MKSIIVIFNKNVLTFLLNFIKNFKHFLYKLNKNEVDKGTTTPLRPIFIYIPRQSYPPVSWSHGHPRG